MFSDSISGWCYISKCVPDTEKWRRHKQIVIQRLMSLHVLCYLFFFSLLTLRIKLVGEGVLGTVLKCLVFLCTGKYTAVWVLGKGAVFALFWGLGLSTS